MTVFTKPFNRIELTARVKAHLRRNRIINQKQQQEELLTFNNMVINLANCTVKINDTFVNLSTKEFQLLSLLAKHPNQVFNMDYLIKKFGI